jgi:hypothetical protein
MVVFLSVEVISMRAFCFSIAWVVLGLTQAASGGEYRDDELGFAFVTPNLGVAPAGQQVQRVLLMGPQIDNFAPNVKVQVKHLQTTREAMIEQSDKDFAASGMTVKAKNLREVNGLPAVSYECEWTYQTIPLRMVNLVVIEPQRMIILTCTASQSVFPNYEAEFRKTVDSFVVRR